MNLSICLRWVLATLALLLALGCKEKPEPEPIDYADGIFIVNEGNFQGGNASLSFLRHADDSLYHDVFQAELERPLGDVAQSIALLGGRAYVVVNNSGKVEVLDLPTLASACTITGLQSPRYLLPIGGGRALVSDLYADAIHIVDLGTCTKTGQIAVGGWTEEMLLLDGKAWALQTGTDRLLCIDPAGPALLDSVALAREPNSLVADRDGRLWILTGSALGTVSPHLMRFDPDSMRFELDLAFAGTSHNPSKLSINPTGDTLYFLDGGIWRMGIGEGSLPAQPWVPQGGHTWYGLDIEPSTGLVYATDALDYQRRGTLYRFSPRSSTPLKSWQVGVIPGEMGWVN